MKPAETPTPDQIAPVANVKIKKQKVDPLKPPPGTILERKDFGWLITGGFILSSHAGYLNVVCLMDRQAVGHTTGLMGNFALYFSRNEFDHAFYSLCIILAFIFGAFITGVFAGSHKFHLDSRYGLIIIVEALLIALAFAIFNLIPGDEWNVFGYPLVAIASGMQNAMCTGFSGAVIRTTHTTGTSTDIGLVVGQYVRDLTYRRWLGKAPKCQDMWKIKVLLPLWFGYLFGAFVGAYVFKVMHFSAMGLPAITLGIVGVFYLLLRSYINFRKTKLAQQLVELPNDIQVQVRKLEKKVEKLSRSTFPRNMVPLDDIPSSPTDDDDILESKDEESWRENGGHKRRSSF